ncbi:MAG: ABC transporter substrate-binding protein [Metallosphaera sp.]|uniref:ABC transporter substrate-binding protein n=1 Tax=Metallosphaera sp. TaxID=2020860 RepID=UPI00315F7282
MKIFNDVLNESIEIEYPPKRIVSLDPAATETLFLLGLEDKVVGTDAFSYRPEGAKRKVKLGSYTHVKYDLLEGLNPDIIFTTLGAQKYLGEELAKRGYPVYPLRVSTSVSAILNNVLILGNAIGEFEKSRSLYLELLNKINQLPRFNYRPIIYVELDLGGPITPGFPSHISDGIWLAGGMNLFDGTVDAYVEPKIDALLQREPDFIIYEPKRERPDELTRFMESLERRGLHKLKNLPVFMTRGDFLAHQGPSFITEVMPWINNVISSWLRSRK